MHQRVEKIDVNNSIRTAYLRWSESLSGGRDKKADIFCLNEPIF
jgi:hypothetical protein